MEGESEVHLEHANYDTQLEMLGRRADELERMTVVSMRCNWSNRVGLNRQGQVAAVQDLSPGVVFRIVFGFFFFSEQLEFYIK